MKHCFLYLLTFLTLTSLAQTIPKGTVRGTVITVDGQPAAYVNVMLKGTNRGVLTDEAGRFTLKNVPVGPQRLFISLMGHQSEEQSIDVQPGETVTRNIALAETARQLQEVVVNGGNRFSRKETDYVARMPLANLENPQVYSIIPSTLLKEQNIVDYKTAMRNAPGTSTLAQAGNGRSYTLMRGFITGNWVRNGLAAYQFSAVDPANIERIEVIKGPSGTLFNTSVISYGGLINRVTKKPTETAFAELAYTGGSFGLNRVTADVNTPLNASKRVLFRLNAAYHRQNSFQDSGFERNYFIAPSMTYRLTDKLSVNVEAELYQRHTSFIGDIGIGDYSYWKGKTFRDIPVDYTRSYQGNDVDTRLTNYNLYAQGTYQFNEHWRSQTLFTVNGVSAPNQLFLFKTVLNTTDMQRRVGRLSDQYHQTQIQQNVNGDVRIGNVRNRLLFGLDFVAYRQDPYYFINTNYDQINYTQPGNFFVSRESINRALDTLTVSKSDQNTYNSAVYVADVINLTDRLTLLASVRVDHYQDKGAHDLTADSYDGAFSQTKASPKFGLVYQLIKNQLSLFGNYQNGFSYTNSKDENGKLFKPEQAFQYEGGVKLEAANNKLSATISYYDILVKDKLRANPANPNFYVQDATQRSRGLETELIANPVRGLNILLGYGYNDNVYTKAEAEIEGKRPYGTPAHLINGWVSYVLRQGSLKGAGIGAGGNYASRSYADDTNLLIAPSYSVLSATLFYDRPTYRIGLKLDNMTNERYWGPFIQPQPTRSFSVNLSYKFASR